MSFVLHVGAVPADNSVQKMSSGKDPGPIETRPAPDDVYTFHSQPQHTYSSCFGLPYQDHNYGAPPPPTPPQSPPPMKINGHIDVVEETVNIVVAKAVSELNQAASVPALPDPLVDDSITRCICDYQHDDGYMICCDKCSVWQHIDCMSIDRNNIPDAYCCELCEPRAVDKKKARDLQTRKREELTDSSATDTDPDEAAHHIALLKAQASVKKGKNKRTLKKDLKDNKAQKLKRMKEKKKERKEKRAKKGVTNNVDVSVTISKMKLQNNKENAKKLPQLKSPKKNRSVDFQLEEAKDAWNSSQSPWVDGYEPARNNHYSSALQEILSVNTFNGQYSDELNKVGELQVQLCCVTEVKKNRKGLKASELIPGNQAIIEYVGRVMLKDQYDTNNIFFKMLHPFVLFYSNFDNTNLCIDASNYGNDARFVRRSCTPNAEIRHVVSSGSIRFYIFSSKEIPSGEEITIPFDYQYKDCSFSVECACPRLNCVVSRKKRKRNNSQNRNKEETSPIICRTSKRCQAQKAKEQEQAQAVKEEAPPIPIPLQPPDTSFLESLANAAVAVSMAEQSLSEQNAQAVEEVEPKVEPDPVEKADTTITPSLPIEGETEEQAAEREKKMTREERKMHAIMKAFEKLEKREERRKEALARLETSKKKVEKSEDADHTPVPEVKQEPQVEQKSIRGKRRKSHPARRRSRVSSGNSECTAGSEDSNMGTPTSAPNTPSPEKKLQKSPPNNTDKNFRFLKTKRHLMNEWLSEKTQAHAPKTPVPNPVSSTPLPAPVPCATPVSSVISKLEPLEVKVEETMVFTCLPSPRNNMEYMRRNSQSACDRPGPGSSIGSAKKRWLRQAMCESTQSSDSGKESPSPYCDGTSPSHTPQLPSPGGSPAIDFVTPLKKRRLARESLSADHPPTPSNLSPPLPGTIDEHNAQALFGHEDSNSNMDSSGKSSTTQVKMEVERAEQEPSSRSEPLLSEDNKMMPESVLDASITHAQKMEKELKSTPVNTDNVREQQVENISGTSEVKEVAMEINESACVLVQLSENGTGNVEQKDIKSDNVVVSSDTVCESVIVDKDCGISTSTETVHPQCSADTSTSAVNVDSENAQKLLTVQHSTAQPSSTAVLENVASLNQGSNSTTARQCDSLSESSCQSSAIGDVSRTSPSTHPLPSNPDQGTSTSSCSPIVVTDSSALDHTGGPRTQNLQAVAAESSNCALERLTHDSVTSQSTDNSQPADEASVSSTSQACAPPQSLLGTREATEDYSPGVSSTVCELHKDNVSSQTHDQLSHPVSGNETYFSTPCDSSIGQSISPEASLPPSSIELGAMTVMSADSTSAPPPPSLPPPPQPPPPPLPTKKKVSLLEYRKRLKTKGSGSQSSSSSSPTTPGNSVTPPQGSTTPTLAPLPFFDPSSPGRSDYRDGYQSPVKKDEDVRLSNRQPEKPLSLTERLRMEFGLEDSDDEEDPNPEKKEGVRDTPSPPPPPPPSHAPPPPPIKPSLEGSLDNGVVHTNHVGGVHLANVYPVGDPRVHGTAIPQPVPPPPTAGQVRLGLAGGRHQPHFQGRVHPANAVNHPSPRSQSPHMFNQSPPLPQGANKAHPSSTVPPHPTLYHGGSVNPNGGVVGNSRGHGAHHPAVYSTPSPQQRPTAHKEGNYNRSNSKQSNYSMGPHRQRLGGQATYNHTQYPVHAPTRPAHYSSGAVPPPPANPVGNSNQSFPGKPQTAATQSSSAQNKTYSTRTSSNYNSHSYNNKKYY